MPVFRDAQGQLYRISKKELESFLITDEGEARITGVELSQPAAAEAQQEAPGYVWASGERHALGYQWPEEQVLGYEWPEEVAPYESTNLSQQAANEGLASRFDVAN